MPNTIDTIAYRDSDSDSTYSRKVQSERTSSTNASDFIRTPVFTRSRGEILSQKLRGSVETYAQTMMGGFKYVIKHDLPDSPLVLGQR